MSRTHAQDDDSFDLLKPSDHRRVSGSAVREEVIPLCSALACSFNWSEHSTPTYHKGERSRTRSVSQSEYTQRTLLWLDAIRHILNNTQRLDYLVFLLPYFRVTFQPPLYVYTYAYAHDRSFSACSVPTFIPVYELDDYRTITITRSVCLFTLLSSKHHLLSIYTFDNNLDIRTI